MPNYYSKNTFLLLAGKMINTAFPSQPHYPQQNYKYHPSSCIQQALLYYFPFIIQNMRTDCHLERMMSNSCSLAGTLLFRPPASRWQRKPTVISV